MSTGEKLARVSRFYAHHGNSLRLICESSTQLNQLRYLHVKWQDLNRFAVIRRPRVNATRLIHSIAFNFSIAINVIMTIAVHLVTASRGEVCSNFIGWFKDCFRGNLDQVEYFIILFLYNPRAANHSNCILEIAWVFPILLFLLPGQLSKVNRKDYSLK